MKISGPVLRLEVESIVLASIRWAGLVNSRPIIFDGCLMEEMARSNHGK